MEVLEFEQIKTGLGNYTPITDETIDKIAVVKAFDDNKLNIMMYQHHQELLKIAKNKNDHKEVGFFWDLENPQSDCFKIRGELNGINMSDDPGVVELVKYGRTRTVVMMHNHPRNGLFSGLDIQSFIRLNSIYIMTAICNDGTIYMMRKESNFNPLKMSMYYNEGVEQSKKEYNNKNTKKSSNIDTKSCYYGVKNVAKHAKEIGITYRCSVKRK